jgi:hypothetical protein
MPCPAPIPVPILAFNERSRPNALARCIGTGSGRFGTAGLVALDARLALGAVKTRAGSAARMERPLEGDM